MSPFAVGSDALFFGGGISLPGMSLRRWLLEEVGTSVRRDPKFLTIRQKLRPGHPQIHFFFFFQKFQARHPQIHKLFQKLFHKLFHKSPGYTSKFVIWVDFLEAGKFVKKM